MTASTTTRLAITLTSLILSAFVTAGCGGPGLSPQQDVDHWLGQVPANATSCAAHNTLADNDFSPWFSGRMLYGYRDKVASQDYADGVTMQLEEDPSGHVASKEAYGSPDSPYPLLLPAYPSY